MKGVAELNQFKGKMEKDVKVHKMILHGDRKMEKAMARIRAEGDDGGETKKWGARHKHKRHRRL